MRNRKSVVVVLILLAAAAITTRWRFQVEYVDLYSSRLHICDVIDISALLSRHGIVHVVGRARNSVQVEASERTAVLVFLAERGLPEFEALERRWFVLGHNHSRTKTEMQLQSELADIIRGLEMIEDAWVVLRIPDRVYFREDEPPTEGIVLELKPDQVLPPRIYHGLKSLVAHSVPEMTIANVKVIREEGSPANLYRYFEADRAELSRKIFVRQMLQDKLEKELVNRVYCRVESRSGEHILDVNIDNGGPAELKIVERMIDEVPILHKGSIDLTPWTFPTATN